MSAVLARKNAGRLAGRLRLLPRALTRRFLRLRRRERPAVPRRILIAHHLLLGDTLMLTALLAKLREQHPQASIVMTVRRAYAPLYASRPYGVEPVVFEPREAATLDPLFAPEGYDLAYVPGDNRHAWLAAAAGARWIVAHAGDRPGYKSWPVDELRQYPDTPTSWADSVTMLADGPAPRAYRPQNWPAPLCVPFDRPGGEYCVIHVGASSALKRWHRERWLAVAVEQARRGLPVVWSAGPGEENEVAAIDPERRFPSYAGKLDLAQLWQLIKGARLLLSPDTGIAHLGRLTGTPSVTLYGPASATLVGPGDFLRELPCRSVTVADFPCRDQNLLFKREIAWVRRCQRTLAECPAPRCLQAIGVDEVLQAALNCSRHAG
ncbi:MAG: heptosyltransferase [Betaproteobacteria bacterium]|nr:heptosyltransferase [Betaproteobacteria bacterium]MSQ87922.1 heptosyltransferase [Betaproteobacteria bacterium]